MIRLLLILMALSLSAAAPAQAQSTTRFSDLASIAPSDTACVFGYVQGVDTWRKFCFPGIADYT